MHLILDGSILPALFVLAIVIWACGAHVTSMSLRRERTTRARIERDLAEDLGARLREKLAAAPPRTRKRIRVTPIYDEKFAALLVALGAESGIAQDFEGVVEFPDDLWKSGWRGGDGNVPE